jgi:PAS domain S-box-containing protein
MIPASIILLHNTRIHFVFIDIMNFRCTLFFLILLSLLAPVISQLSAQSDYFDESWRWVRFTTESGLPSDHITSLTETNDGTVWITTEGGIAWFDGYQWHQVHGLPQQRLSLLFPYENDKIVVNAEGVLYAVSRDSFTPLLNRNLSIVATDTGSSLLITMNNTLFKFADDTLKPLEGVSKNIQGKINGFWKTRGGALWISTLAGVYKREKEGWRKKIGPSDTDFGITNVVEDQYGNGFASVLLPVERRGLYEWFNDGDAIRNEIEIGYDNKSMDIGPNGDAIVIYNSGDIRMRRNRVWSSLLQVQSKLPTVEFVRWRNNGDLWFGTEEGLYLFSRSSSRWTVLSHSGPDVRNSINEILQAGNGDIWVGTTDGVVIYRNNKMIKHIPKILNTSLYAITGLAEDNEGNVWISSGASFDGAFCWNGKDWRYVSVSNNAGGARFHKIKKDAHGQLWFLGLSHLYAYRDSQEVGTFLYDGKQFSHWGVDDGLVHGRVYSFAQGSDSSLWFGTLGGISRWTPLKHMNSSRSGNNAVNGFWKHWTQATGLRYNKIFTMTVDKENRLWFGHSNTSGGLGYIDKNDSVHYFTVADGLLNNNVWDLSVDSSGVLWISTDGGLCSYSEGTWLTYDEKTGLVFSKLWPVFPSRGKIYVGTRGRGLAILNKVETPQYFPRIVIERPVVDDHNILIRWKPYAYWGNVSPEEILTRYRVGNGKWSAWNVSREITERSLDVGDYTFQIQAKGLFGDFDPKGESVTFSVLPPVYLRPVLYLPAGFLVLAVVFLGVILVVRKRKHDAELRKSEAKFRAVAEMSPSAIMIYQNDKFLFANLGAQELTGYTIHELLNMSLNDIISPEYLDKMKERERARTGKTLIPSQAEFTITTKQGEKRWVDYRWGWIRFQGMPATLGSAIDITERKQSEEKLRLLTQELTATEERERHRMATYLHDVIGQTLALCKIKIRGLQKSLPENSASVPLNEIQSLIEQSIHNTQSLTFELCPPILYELSFEAAVGWLTERLHQQHGITFELQIDAHLKPLTDEIRGMLFQAVREVFVNVIKHADATNVQVLLKQEAGIMTIIIRDNGTGFDADSVHKNMNKKGGGFGLFNIRERLKYLGGKFEITSLPGNGTQVTLSIPMNSTTLV